MVFRIYSVFDKIFEWYAKHFCRLTKTYFVKLELHDRHSCTTVNFKRNNTLLTLTTHIKEGDDFLDLCLPYFILQVGESDTSLIINTDDEFGLPRFMSYPAHRKIRSDQKLKDRTDMCEAQEVRNM